MERVTEPEYCVHPAQGCCFSRIQAEVFPAAILESLFIGHTTNSVSTFYTSTAEALETPAVVGVSCHHLGTGHLVETGTAQ